MNVEEAISYIKNSGCVSDMSHVLFKEIKRLREQRELLGQEIFRLGNKITSPLWGYSTDIGPILDEIDLKKQEEEKMTVDEATSYLSRYYPTVTATLANEIKRFREELAVRITKETISHEQVPCRKDEKIKRLELIIHELSNDLCRIHEFSNPMHNSDDI